YWFSLERPRTAEPVAPPAEQPTPLRLEVAGSWETACAGAAGTALAAALPGLLRTRRWFGGKAMDVKIATIATTVRFEHEAGVAHFALIRVEYVQGGDVETYVWPLTFAADAAAAVVQAN